ncbi:hypothetical protein F4813DRAFT_401105 [Daldinia decipiens]|uniref:uncharacterized protein n=1 Tax=Daldinia decipiens TaxID=326647 RepID=UPI0020C33A01|nr:uncharacterized protein F4813DRAFT_401105 [Daldinia decipiens]KAI1660138.1 hypothetical protein F4813DRAFT_401105 [Daldinia decipiens]
MGPFALPVPNYRLGAHHRINKPKKKDESQENEEEVWVESEWDTPSSRLPSDSINPLSHTPDTLRQFAVAGLSPTEEIPSKANPLFPHKPIQPERKGHRKRDVDKDNENATEKRDKAVTSKQHSERLQHLSTLTAILHRCLGEGDILRAKRAFGLLVQTKDVDIRQAGLWAIGSEILMRDGESEEGQLRYKQGRDNELRRWGSAANVDKVRSYFETLIQQHPHDPHRPQLTSALDFWPALFGIEVYNIDAEMRAATHRLQRQQEQEQDPGHEEEEEEEDEDEDEGGYGFDVDMAYSDETFESQRELQAQRRRQATYAARDEIRTRALVAAEAVAKQMDQVMENAPYGAHRGLLRLRAHLALFVGDLCLPARLVVDGSRVSGEERGKRTGKGKGRSGEDGLRARAETAEDHAALARRGDEQGRARMLFRKVLDGGGGGEPEGEGGADSWVREFVDEGEDEEVDGRDDTPSNINHKHSLQRFHDTSAFNLVSKFGVE